MSYNPAYTGDTTPHEYEKMLSPRVRNKTRKGMSWPVRLLIMLLLALVLSVVIVLKVRQSDVQQATEWAETFVIAMQSEHADSAYNMGNEAFRQATTEEQLSTMFDQTEPYLRQAVIEVTDTYYAVSKNGDPRAIIVFAATRDTRITYIRIVMERQNGIWKVHSLLTRSDPLQAKPE